jgi:E3 ubiquitin-protein ligase SHPRH
LSIDRLQKIHTIHNLNEVLVLHKNEVEDEILKRQQDDCEKSYMSSFDATKHSHQEKLKKKIEGISENLEENHHEFEAWWVILLNKLVETNRSKEFLERLSMEISLNYNSGLNDNMLVVHTICGKSFTTIDGLKKICVNELEKFSISRVQLLESLNRFFDNIDRVLITNATSCHLRPTDFSKKKNKCELCKADNSFHHYAKCLFSHSDEILKFTEDQMKKNENISDDVDDEGLNSNENLITDGNLIENLNRDKANAIERKFYRSTTDLEKLFRLLCSMFRNDDKLNEYVKIGKTVLELYESYKEEFKLCRQFWLSASYQINAYDELEMAKIRMRLREPTDVVIGVQEANYIIERSEVPLHKIRANNDKTVAEVDLRKKLGQFLYLQNLSKVRRIN